ncbi:hypothetical protein N9111_00870 [bacterium]|nr:hypothetical protein [bacterium]
MSLDRPLFAQTNLLGNPSDKGFGSPLVMLMTGGCNGDNGEATGPGTWQQIGLRAE